MQTLYASVQTTEGTINARFSPQTNTIFASIGDYCMVTWHPQSGEARYTNNSAKGYSQDHKLALIDAAWWDKHESQILSELFSAWRKY